MAWDLYLQSPDDRSYKLAATDIDGTFAEITRRAREMFDINGECIYIVAHGGNPPPDPVFSRGAWARMP